VTAGGSADIEYRISAVPPPSKQDLSRTDNS
jgi:hypothetical protein